TQALNCHVTYALLQFAFTTSLTPKSTLFPYTTLFRSGPALLRVGVGGQGRVDLSDLSVGDRGQPQHLGVLRRPLPRRLQDRQGLDRKSTRLNSSHEWTSYAVFCLNKKNS